MPTGCRARRRNCWRIPVSTWRGSRRSGRSWRRSPPAIAEQLEIDARYAGYLDRQARDIAAFRRDEALLLPDDLDYAAVGGLSAEIRGKLAAARPATLGAAGADFRGDPGGAGRAAAICEAAAGSGVSGSAQPALDAAGFAAADRCFT